MAKITAAEVKELRGLTGAGMGACKKALVETDGDIEKAVDLLRAKGVKQSQTARDAAEGGIRFGLSEDKKTVAIVELRCETDFAARNENFQALLGTIMGAVLEQRPASLEDARAIPAIAEGIQDAAAVKTTTRGKTTAFLTSLMGVPSRFRGAVDGCCDMMSLKPLPRPTGSPKKGTDPEAVSREKEESYGTAKSPWSLGFECASG